MWGIGLQVWKGAHSFEHMCGVVLVIFRLHNCGHQSSYENPFECARLIVYLSII